MRERETSAALEQALAEARTLRRLLPICAWCKRISDGRGGWEPVEVYLARHSETRFTHGICQDCAAAMEWSDTAG